METTDGAARLARTLGWFSIGLGLAQAIIPNDVARLAGAEPTADTTRLMRALGLRELSSGIGILSGKQTDAWVRARVAGDLMDLALLGRVLTSDRADRGKTFAAGMAVLGVTVLDMMAAAKLGQSDNARENMMKTDEASDTKQVRRAITINRPPSEVAAFWQTHAGDDDALMECVTFVPAPGNRGTEVHLSRTYEKPGAIASVLAKFRHDDPDQLMTDELSVLKQILETGDVLISDAWINGPHKTHPAQPE